MSRAMMSSATPEWATPMSVFEPLDREFGFTLDTAATAENAKCARFYTVDHDGLKQPWTGRVWCNPPYGREIPKWVKRGAVAAMSGEADLVVLLVPARTDTAWWHDNIQPERKPPHPWVREIIFRRGRIKFVGTLRGSAPFPSAIVVMGPPVAIEANAKGWRCPTCDAYWATSRPTEGLTTCPNCDKGVKEASVE